jgi:hypothetical protein
MPNTKPHPLEPVVMQAFADREVHDPTSLGYALAGAIVMPRKGSRAYQTVAADVLGYMFSQGKLIRDDIGWYRLATTVVRPSKASIKSMISQMRAASE